MVLAWVPFLALAGYVAIDFYQHILTPSSHGERFALSFFISLGLASVIIPAFVGLQGMKPWLPWVPWGEMSWGKRCFIFGGALCVIMLDWGFGVGEMLIGLQRIGPLGEASTFVVGQSLSFALAYVVLVCGFGVVRGVLQWFIDASNALQDK